MPDAGTTAERRSQTARLEDLPLDQRRQHVLRALDGEIDRAGLTLTYRLGILTVTAVMILLPLIYLGIIAATGWAVWYHFTHHTGMLGAAGSGRGALFAFLMYLSPGVIGGVLVLFMFKPFFSRPHRPSPPRQLKRQHEPLLFEFVDRLCEVVGAPKPKQINVDNEVNASASLRRGVWSVFLGNDLTLTIGLPLMAGFSLRQFGGVLAHEFGHFSQGVGMRLTFIIRSISHWFTRVVYERDEWDHKLEQASQSIDLRIGWILYVTRLFVWMTRKILWLLMMIGHGVSGFMLRQMEFDADRYEARFSGSDTFESTSRRLNVLGYANQRAHNALAEFFEEGRLVDNFPALIVHNAGQFTKEELKKIRQLSEEREEHWFDTHPSDVARIASAQRENAPGLFRLKAPASVLSADFDKLCRIVTMDFYRQALGKKFRKSDVHPFAEMLSRQEAEQETMQALQRCLQGHYSFLGRISPLEQPADPGEPSLDALRDELTDLRQQLLAGADSYQQCVEKRFELDRVAVESRQAEALLIAKFTFPRDAFSRDFSSRGEIQRQRDALDNEAAGLRRKMAGFENAATQMVGRSLAALEFPEIRAALPEAEAWTKELAGLRDLLRRLDAKRDDADKLRYNFASLELLLNQLQQQGNNESLVEALLKLMSRMTERLSEFWSALSGTTYPFDHARGEISVGTFLVENRPAADNPSEVYGATQSLLDRYYRLRARILGRMCQMAEAVQGALGLERLPEPAESEDGAEDGEVSPV